MKIKYIPFRRSLAVAGAAFLLLSVAPSRAHARFVFTLTETGGNVVVNGSGTINTAALTLGGGGGASPNIYPASGQLIAGSAMNTVNYSFYTGGGLSGPTAFGGGTYTVASSGTGSAAGFWIGYPDIFVPQGYASGSLLTASDTYTGQTFATLGFTPGTYTYTWGTGASADSLTVTSVVPEPSAWALFIAGGISLLGVVFRRRSA